MDGDVQPTDRQFLSRALHCEFYLYLSRKPPRKPTSQFQTTFGRFLDPRLLPSATIYHLTLRMDPSSARALCMSKLLKSR